MTSRPNGTLTHVVYVYGDDSADPRVYSPLCVDRWYMAADVSLHEFPTCLTCMHRASKMLKPNDGKYVFARVRDTYRDQV